MKIRVQGQGWQTMKVRDLSGRRAITLQPVGTQGGKRVAAGVEVKVSAHARFVNLDVPTCPHCGISFEVRLGSVEAPQYIELLPVAPTATKEG